MLKLKNIRKDYVTSSETVHALKGVNLSFRKREFVSILGPSGCGKTTLLNIIGGLDHYTSGDLIINGKSTRSFKDKHWDVYRNHRVGFIFQSYNLIPHQTVLGNVELALTIAGVSREERIARAKAALDKVGLAGQYYKRPNQLSGGQCQRVAIARALVNDPEILLADEPTGALDTVTSVQIMELIKEISEERLVIMVTHNPELADMYSTRIIRFLDGKVVEDTDPPSAREEAEEAKEEHLAKKEAIYYIDRKGKRKKSKKSKEKAKMSLPTAFRLSFVNLLSKKGRTSMVGFAGSIGIVGIAMVLALSSGIKGFVANMQDDMLSGNPIEIAQTAYDLNALTGMMENSDKKDIIKNPNRVYINSLVEYLASMNESLNNVLLENTITQEYIDYVKAMPKEYYNAMILGYGIDLSPMLYTDFVAGGSAEAQNISIHALTSIYTSILSETEFGAYASYVTALVPSFQQAPSNKSYILDQYDLVGEGSKIAEGKNEVMLVLDKNEELTDILLARLGYYTQDEFIELVKKVTAEEGEYEGGVRDSFSYDELLGKTFTWYSNDQAFTKVNTGVSEMYMHNPYSDNFNKEEGVELKVVGILKPKENVNYGSLSSGIYYTEALTDMILEKNAESQIVSDLNAGNYSPFLINTGVQTIFGASYSYNYVFDNGDGNTEPKSAFGMVMNSPDMASMMMGNVKLVTEQAEDFCRVLGGNSCANHVLIYPLSFDDKDLVTEYLDKWNADGSIKVGDKTYSPAERNEITYTDTLELVISIINTMIDVVSYALIAFTSISLVVSTVMIGIITYVSVVERIKEIGVIRSLGGRKKDVSHLFNAETFIIGLLSGLMGVGITYLASIVVNAILKPVIGYGSICALPVWQAAVLVALSILLTSISGLIPARSAAKKDPVVALRTE